MTWNPALEQGRRRPLPIVLALVLLGSGACSKPAAGPGAGPPAVPVEVRTLALTPVEQATEFVGVVKSRRSTTVKPQVEGFVTRIMARSGDHVQPGTPLMQIDPSLQRAAVANLESQRVSREAALQLARQEAARTKTLLEAGASSESEMQQAQTALATAEAQLQAADAQLRQQNVTLGYHQVTSPTTGVVGDIPVRVGDSVTKSTALTTIDENAGLEVYIYVPVQEAEHLKLGVPVRLLDQAGAEITRTELSFVAPAVDPRTQSVLAKATVAQGTKLRTEQFVRAQMVWADAPGLTVPVVAVNRVNGQYFVFVAEPGQGGSMVARQRPVDLGTVVGNDYVVKSGLKPGEKLIVSGVQKIVDGAPVTPTSPQAQAPAQPTQTSAGKGD